MKDLRKLEAKKKQIQKANLIASKYRSAFEMPEYELPPADYRKDKTVLESKNIMKFISPTFNPTLYPNQQLHHVWTKVLQYGKEYYLNEQELKKVLSVVLSGDPLESFIRAERRGSTLKEIIEELMTLYDSGATLNDYKRELDNFQRPTGEPIRKTMIKYRNLWDKFKHTYADDTWPEILEMKLIMGIKTLIAQSTKQHIELEENRIKRAGATMGIETYISMAEEFEDIHNAIPKKPLGTILQTASAAAPAVEQKAPKVDKASVYVPKELVDTIKDLKDLISVNNVTQQQQLQQIQKMQEQINTAKKRRIEDNVMEFDPIPRQQPSNANRAEANPNFQARADNNPGKQTRADNVREGQTQAEVPRYPKQQAGQQNPTNPDQDQAARPQRSYNNYGNYRGRGRGNYSRGAGQQMMRIRGTLYGMCYPCATTHVIGTPCPKDNPEFDVYDIEDDHELPAIEHTESEN